jgi:polyisoprenoid-binding protein YceI
MMLAALAVAVVGVIGAASVWYFLIRSDAPPEVSLSAAQQSVAAATAAPSTSGSAPATSATSVPSGNTGGSASTGLTGTWSLVRGQNTFVGYRVNEQLVGVGAATAVGRTQNVTGTLTFDGRAITAVEITANVATLASDKSMRDQALRTQALETGRYPNATFKLSQPISIAAVPADGQKVTQTVTGDLTLHGVTKSVQISIEGVIQGGQLIVVGSTRIQFSDFNIAQPRAAAVLSVEDNGVMEFQLVFAKAAV